MAYTGGEAAPGAIAKTNHYHHRHRHHYRQKQHHYHHIEHHDHHFWPTQAVRQLLGQLPRPIPPTAVGLMNPFQIHLI